MQQTFENGATQKRPITIKIENGCITFHFKNEGDREFYWIEVKDWDAKYLKHMNAKNWFSKEMADFINTNIK